MPTKPFRFAQEFKLLSRMGGFHPASACAHQAACPVHKPSGHHMRTWPMVWRADLALFERVCPCGVGHPDPDQVPYLTQWDNLSLLIHGCCGCCKPSGTNPYSWRNFAFP